MGDGSISMTSSGAHALANHAAAPPGVPAPGVSAVSTVGATAAALGTAGPQTESRVHQVGAVILVPQGNSPGRNATQGCSSEQSAGTPAPGIAVASTMRLLREHHARLVRDCQDLRQSTGDLTMRHSEIVAVLTHAIENMISKMKIKVGSDAAALLEQAAYVAAAVKEREIVTKDLEAETELRRERETELIQTKEELSEAQNEVTRLSQKCHELGTTVENRDLQLNHFVEFQEEAKILGAPPPATASVMTTSSTDILFLAFSQSRWIFIPVHILKAESDPIT
jgi:hypothetical protein